MLGSSWLQKGILPSTRIFNHKEIVVLGLGFVIVVILANRLVRLTCKYIIEFDCPSPWPISIFSLRVPPSWEALLTAAVILLLFWVALGELAKAKYRISYVVLTGVILVLATNLVQGLDDGFIRPISGDNIQFYHDAVEISNASHFLRHFDEIQPDLEVHSRTHPPGPPLTVYALLKIVNHPGFVSVSIAIVSVSLSLFFLHQLMSREFDTITANYAAFLFILIPAVQIYYLASMDALISSFLLGVLFFFRYPKPSISIFGSLVFLLLASFFTFGFFFILPILVGFEVLSRRRITRSLAILGGLVLLYILIHTILGFDYFTSFRIASSLENPEGFRLIADPVSYGFTRLEGIAEIALFFGPFLTVLMLRGRHLMKKDVPDLYLLTALGIVTLLSMLLAGAYRTGETARVGLFIYPYLLFPVVVYLRSIEVRFQEEIQLARLVFSQSVMMQLLGNYFW